MGGRVGSGAVKLDDRWHEPAGQPNRSGGAPARQFSTSRKKDAINHNQRVGRRLVKVQRM